MAKQLVFQRLARQAVSEFFNSFDQDTHGIDERGLCDATVEWLEENHGDVIQMETRTLLGRSVMNIIKRIVRESRPTARAIAARYASGQIPMFEEAAREIYRDVDGIAVRLIDMRKEAAFYAALAYVRLGDENHAKGRRLFAVWQEMETRGLADNETVRKLYSA